MTFFLKKNLARRWVALQTATAITFAHIFLLTSGCGRTPTIQTHQDDSSFSNQIHEVQNLWLQDSTQNVEVTDVIEITLGAYAQVLRNEGILLNVSDDRMSAEQFSKEIEYARLEDPAFQKLVKHTDKERINAEVLVAVKEKLYRMGVPTIESEFTGDDTPQNFGFPVRPQHISGTTCIRVLIGLIASIAQCFVFGYICIGNLLYQLICLAK